MSEQILSQNDINYVNEIIIEAGKLALTLQKDLFSSNRDLKTKEMILSADEKISAILVKKVRSRFTDHAIISEEDFPKESDLKEEYVWMIDPIDGTHHYLANDSQYSIMIGLVCAGKPIYGWIYNSAFDALYHGGPGLGAWCKNKDNDSQAIYCNYFVPDTAVRVILGRRDKKYNPWLDAVSDIQIIEAGSIGYKLSKILENEADVLLHLAGRLKVWDTAGPVALALGAGMEVGSKDIDYLNYPENSFQHPVEIVIGKSGSLQWFRSKIVPSWIR
jgi:3'(2'), 5'-bisphosphate nucleotidase